MVSKLFLFLFALGFQSQLFANVDFISVKDEAWRAETLETMEWVNSQLPSDWSLPKDFQVAYVPGTDPRYYPLFRYKKADGTMESVEKVLVVGSENKAIFIHEYAHLIFDQWLRDTSAPWQYFIVWQSENYADLATQLKSYEKLIPNLEKIHQESLDKQAAGDESEMLQKMIENTSRSANLYKIKVEKIKDALQLSENSPHPLNSLNSFQALQSYNELFADTLAAVILEDWQIMKQATEEQLAAPDAPEIILPPATSEERSTEIYLTYRDFLPGLNVESYAFKDWESDSAYWQFAPVRSEIRALHEEEKLHPSQTIRALGVAIRSVYEKLLIPEPTLIEASLEKKNLDLINAFEGSIVGIQ